MIRQASLTLYFLGTVLASATDSDSRRVDALVLEQEQNKTKKFPASQSFILGNTELRVDNPKNAPSGPVIQPAVEASQASVTLRQPLHENVALSFSNEFGSQKAEAMPFSKNENSYSLNRKEIWALDWTRSSWNGRAYTENQSGGNGPQIFSAQQKAYGLRTGTQLPTETNVSVEVRQENNLLPSSGTQERNIYQTQFSQKLGSLPLTFDVIPGLENETGLNGEALSRSTRFNNALRWQANPQTRVVFGSGLNSKDYFDATREETKLYFSQFDTTLQKDLSFSLRSDFQDLVRNSAGIASYQEQKMSIQVGPRIRLPQDFTAALDMRYGITQQDGSSASAVSEQALALSIQGRF